MYWKYFKYIVQHKWNVFIEAMKMGLIVQAFTHDLSKFLLSEFIPYAQYFYGDKTNKAKYDFKIAWLLHQHRNKHHWDYWVNSSGEAIPIPKKYILHMVCDWQAMGRKFNDTAGEFYNKQSDKMNLHDATRFALLEYFEEHIK